MPFDSGRVTFCRLACLGDGPDRVDDALLSVLNEHRFEEAPPAGPDDVDSGFVTPLHMLDTRFTYEKCGFGEGSTLALIGVRVDRHQVPAEIKRAYRIMNEQAAATGNPSGFATKGQKAEAAEMAAGQVNEDLARGVYRKSKVVPLLWDLPHRRLFCGATSGTPQEEVVKLFRTAFGLDLQVESSGAAVGRILRDTGRTRDHEDLAPSAFTKPPAEGGADDRSQVGGASGGAGTPPVPWTAKAVDLKDFLGNEFALWLWWKTETGGSGLDTSAGEVHALLNTALDLDCAWGLTGRASLRGDGPTRMREAGEALKLGKWPRKLGLHLADAEEAYEFTLAADPFVVSAARLPEVEDAQSPREVVEARLQRVTHLGSLLDAVFDAFLRRRLGGGWKTDREKMREWIQARGR
ncbi:hypothetical protein [Phycisphaera mikurensis]|uniref:Recombination-associated protein RdgC n=1 Tax=Phycisphaera mikurensis (strain NBRC 102666 / KCTC 22515 / FYK2301M01) TaxID=1142394 RepID=I0IAH5_PHYMF|nr:hypothetical protein [Phycisphaera mikurensis]MBB6441740.1 hypothetical protein [Phycisphaera mikurensis]BAM02263.1 hypothetical protein PSMK_01040 [Phycisphaera mikurensis NBRC 102666]